MSLVFEGFLLKQVKEEDGWETEHKTQDRLKDGCLNGCGRDGGCNSAVKKFSHRGGSLA